MGRRRLLRCKYKTETTTLRAISVIITWRITVPVICWLVKRMGIWRKKNKRLEIAIDFTAFFDSSYSRFNINPRDNISSLTLVAKAIAKMMNVWGCNSFSICTEVIPCFKTIPAYPTAKKASPNPTPHKRSGIIVFLWRSTCWKNDFFSILFIYQKIGNIKKSGLTINSSSHTGKVVPKFAR